MIRTGLTHTSKMTVDEASTALTMGSGDLPVLATPAIMALMENAAMLAVSPHLPQELTTVGGHIEASHLRPSLPGDIITARAEVTAVEGKKIQFDITAHCGETLLAKGSHTRFVVNREKFITQINNK